ncbi:hypothetical protein ACMBCN_02445, partial [Candidatus Liberibacter asiaticus]
PQKLTGLLYGAAAAHFHYRRYYSIKITILNSQTPKPNTPKFLFLSFFFFVLSFSFPLSLSCFPLLLYREVQTLYSLQSETQKT